MSDAAVRARAESLERRHGLTRGARRSLLRIVRELGAHERMLEAVEDVGLPWRKSVIVLAAGGRSCSDRSAPPGSNG